ncbi:MAG: FadR family transcriptional regulator [Lachnospiraceae bacterium]|nr:FadR family transcriptional regulator [Lachnospiraceae bacterium]
MELTRVEKRNVSEAIISQLLNLIANGELQPGDKLPSEAELVRAFDASKYSVRSALAQLNTMGLLSTEQGRGTFVRDSSRSELLQPLLVTGAKGSKLLLTTLEFRCGMEAEGARLAAMRRTPEEVEELRQALEKMRKSFRGKRAKEYARADIRFHVVLAKMSRNSWILQSMRIVESLYLADLENTTRWVEFAAHEEIFDAVAAGDADRACARMRQHLLKAEEILQEQIREQKK